MHGSIVDANARAIVLGLFRNVDPTGPAAALDARLGGAIRELALRRMFDGSLGQVYVLPTPRTALLAEFAVFAGLGDFDEFGQDAQAYAAENVIRAFARSRVEDFATVLLGAGSGSSVAAALEGPVARLPGGPAPRGSGARCPQDHDLRARRAQVREPAPRRWPACRRNLARTTSSWSSTRKTLARRAGPRRSRRLRRAPARSRLPARQPGRRRAQHAALPRLAADRRREGRGARRVGRGRQDRAARAGRADRAVRARPARARAIGRAAGAHSARAQRARGARRHGRARARRRARPRSIAGALGGDAHRLGLARARAGCEPPVCERTPDRRALARDAHPR